MRGAAMALNVNRNDDVFRRKQRLETLQSARKWQPSDSIEAAKIDSQITTIQGVIRLLEWRES
jgi:hypothetical protein